MDHFPNCERRLFNRACTCNAAERERIESEHAALMEANDGKMPLASERAKTEIDPKIVNVPMPTGVSEITEAVDAALQKLNAQGLNLDEAIAVIIRRIRG